MIEIYIPGKPPTATAQQKGMNRATGAYYKPLRLREAEVYYLNGLLGKAPEKPLEGALTLSVQFGFPVTKGHKHGDPKITRPDTDNMIKLLKDCLTHCGFWRDDAQVAVEMVAKVYHDRPGVYVEILEWSEEMEV
ncbi:MAG: RusA family crossover junction endodeoxyribonuclease [Bacteroidales bacterium]|nr:RusA family crossover junction endodeoxyribonuclease [Bacteroidales bacterium]